MPNTTNGAGAFRNVAIVAHVDHGKTTLVDAMLKGAGTFRANEAVSTRVMDSNDLERERGITILAKNTAIQYGPTRINIVDTPGHQDFGGEVERVLKMVDGVLLVVDAFDGPMPQTRFVLHKALDLGLKVLVVINKIDRPDARPEEVLDLCLDLFIELEADDAQLDFPVVYCSAKEGYACLSLDELEEAKAHPSMQPLLDKLLEEIPAPTGVAEGPLQVLVSNIEFDPYVGRIAIGRVDRGVAKQNQALTIIRKGEEGHRQGKIAKLMRFAGLGKEEINQAPAGEIVAIAGISDVEIGETLCDVDHAEALDFVKIDEPTIAMTFSVNDSPLAGQEGKYLTSRHLRDRLFRELEKNVSMLIEETDTADAFVVKGRGELSLSILIETMRREGYELQVSKPQVIVKEIDGQKMEPVEELYIDVPEDFVGVVIEKLGNRKAEMTEMKAGNRGYTRMVYTIPTRGLIGYRSEFLTDTKGNGIMNSVIKDYEPWKGHIEARASGVLVATESGEAVTYGLHGAQSRGELFIEPGTRVYEGMVVGRTNQTEDVVVNVCKKKHVTNMRAAGADEALRLVTPVQLSLEQFMEFVSDDELLEITPLHLRLRKKILDTNLRAKARSRVKKEKDANE